MNMTRLLTLLLLAVFPASIPARAQHMNEKDSPCANVAITVDLTNCFAKAKDTADAKLNAVYKKIRDRLDGADAQSLIAAQRLWLRYRDANCSAARDLYEGGSASSAVYLACLEAMTRARTKELEVTYAVRLK